MILFVKPPLFRDFLLPTPFSCGRSSQMSSDEEEGFAGDLFGVTKEKRKNIHRHALVALSSYKVIFLFFRKKKNL